MQIQTLITIIAFIYLAAIIRLSNIFDKRDKEINGTNSGYRSPSIKMLAQIGNILLCIMAYVAFWFFLYLLASMIIQDTYNKDKGIALEYKTEYVNNIVYNGGYELDDRYTLNNNDNIHVVDSDKPYIKYPTRLKIGPFYHSTDKIGLFRDIELYIPKEVADKVDKLKAESIVYTSNIEQENIK